MASSLNMELKTFLVVLRKVSSGELAVRRSQRFQAPVLCLFIRHALPSVMGGALPGRPALYSPEAQEPGITRGGECRVRAGTSAREQAAHGSVPSSAPDPRTSGCPRVL